MKSKIFFQIKIESDIIEVDEKNLNIDLSQTMGEPQISYSDNYIYLEFDKRNKPFSPGAFVMK